jgi:hypothetical protein
VLVRLNVTTALQTANGGSLPFESIETFTLPWSLSTGGTWEASGTSAGKIQEHCGVMAVDRSIVLVCSYDGLVDGANTRLAVFSHDAERFMDVAEAAPENIRANSWAALPNTGEIFFGMNTSGGTYPSSKFWRYRVR